MSKSEIQELKKSIAKLTGRSPVSSDPRYLAQRLADLTARKDAGEDIRHRASSHAVLSISMTIEARQVLDQMIERKKLGASDLVRQALALWAEHNGFAREAEAFSK